MSFQFYQINIVEYSLLTSVYTIPNVVLSLFSGPIVEYFGLRPSAIIFSLLLLLGHILFTVAPLMNSYLIAVTGRLIEG